MTKTKLIILLILFTIVVSAAERISFRFHMSFGSRGIGQGQFQIPLSISSGIDGNLYVADTGNNRVLKFSQNGEYLNQKGGFGWGIDQFDDPTGIFAAKGLDVLVTDKNNHRIIRYDRDLNYISSTNISEFNDESLQGRYPEACAVSDMGDVFVIDGENNRILKINSYGKPEIVFGGYGSAGETLIDPVDICIKGNDKVYVFDKGHKCIMVFDYFGNFIQKTGIGYFADPGGICLDEKGNLFATDLAFGKVIAFDQAGIYSGEILHPEIKSPIDISIYGDKLFILDNAVHQVIIFEINY